MRISSIPPTEIQRSQPRPMVVPMDWQRPMNITRMMSSSLCGKVSRAEYLWSCLLPSSFERSSSSSLVGVRSLTIYRPNLRTSSSTSKTPTSIIRMVISFCGASFRKSQGSRAGTDWRRRPRRVMAVPASRVLSKSSSGASPVRCMLIWRLVQLKELAYSRYHCGSVVLSPSAPVIAMNCSWLIIRRAANSPIPAPAPPVIGSTPDSTATKPDVAPTPAAAFESASVLAAPVKSCRGGGTSLTGSLCTSLRHWPSPKPPLSTRARGVTATPNWPRRVQVIGTADCRHDRPPTDTQRSFLDVPVESVPPKTKRDDSNATVECW
mmetsp:Transcript_33575/g.76778  ORF Transcript_33575/g.76778 Transcript_33575/m.76778 type:complete len:322 (+) Transcript_33575:649-1614(+)